MSETPFKKVLCTSHEKEYEIRVYKRDDGYRVITYRDDQPAFDHGYFCSYEDDATYKNKFGKHGWERLLHCAKADLSGKKIYRVNPVA